MLTQESNFLAFANDNGLINGEHERRWSVDMWLGITDKPLNNQHLDLGLPAGTVHPS